MTDNTIDRRKLLLAGALAGTVGAAAAATRHDGELGGPPETIKGTMPWRDGTADAPPITEGSDYRFFTAAEQAFIEPAIDRMIPADPTGPSASEGACTCFWIASWAAPHRPRRSLLSRRTMAQGAPEARLSKPLQSIAALSRDHSRHRKICLRQIQRQKLQAALDRRSGHEFGPRRAMKPKLHQAGRRGRQSLLRAVPAECARRLLLRSDLWRQQGHGRLEDDRLPRRALRLSRMGEPPWRTRALSAGEHQRPSRLVGGLKRW